MDSTIYSEIFVRRRVLIGDVLGDDLVRNVAGTATEVASCPQMPAPELRLQMRKLRQQVMRGSAFQPPHQPAGRCLRRDRYHTRCKWMSNTVCAPRRYSAIPAVYPARTR